MLNVFITGASSGIGATALLLDRAGHRVFAGVEGASDGVGALSGASPRLQRVEVDVCSSASIAAAVDEIRGQLDGAGLDGVVNNAGIALAGPLETTPLDDLRRQLETNVIGQIAVTQATLPLIRAAGGRIVLMSSIGGRVSSRFAGPYYASKHALEAVGEALRQELDPEGIPVILIEPSIISTPIWAKGIAYLDGLAERLDAAQSARYGQRLSAFRDSLRSADEHGKDPEGVAEAVLEALTSAHPDTRVVVGAAGRLLTALRPFIPDRVADKVAEHTAR
jgi:NAD(P)-dependent dehydrogenase (short-subunit alcohol dehydrogenase family)